eukprot:2461501-Prymnesium_polylepis.2
MQDQTAVSRAERAESAALCDGAKAREGAVKAERRAGRRGGGRVWKKQWTAAQQMACDSALCLALQVDDESTVRNEAGARGPGSEHGQGRVRWSVYCKQTNKPPKGHANERTRDRQARNKRGQTEKTTNQ